MKRAFISFDFDYDEDLRNTLKAQSKRSDSPFELADWSVHEPFVDNWQAKVRDRIRHTDLTIVICGAHTDSAKGVAIELAITQEEKKPYFLLQGRSDIICHKPTSAGILDIIYPWTWENLKRLIDGLR